MQSMELLDIVDEYGMPIGETVVREAAHRNGIRHRTSHVWLLRIHKGKIQVLLQKRSLHKDSYPGCYDISSAGHIPAGDGFLESALRELKEELGVDASTDELIYCGQRRFEFREMFHGQEFRDNQVSNVYAIWRDMQAEEFSVQRSEVDSVLWIDWDKCMDMVKNTTAPHCIWIDELEMIYRILRIACTKCL
jgi:isopentenyldiphosphate isomerase